MIGRKNVDRIAVLVSYDGTSKFLGAPKIDSGTGQNIAEAVYSVLIEWGIAEKVVAFCFDTTSTNTGKNNGACYHLNKLLGRQLIQLACRHHIHEIPLKNVFENKHGATTGPETLIFNRFAKEWDDIKSNQINSGMNDAYVQSIISEEECEEIKEFCYKQLEQKQPRRDYKELLQLVILFLGGSGFGLYTCGATSHARFMSKCIYSIKIFLFRDHFRMTPKEVKCMRDISIFVVKLYIKAWYGCTDAIKSPNQDLNFIRQAFQYKEIDKVVSDSVINKMKNHLWYLSEELVALAFFDSNISIDIKRKMVIQLQARDPSVSIVEYRKHTNPEQLLQCDLSDFVSHKTKCFFVKFDLCADFFDHDPSEWKDNEDYLTASDFCRNLFVVNDNAERGVKFMKDYNRILTRDEEEMQLILQVVDSYHQKFSSHTKSRPR